MFELPEIAVLARQLNAEVLGRRIVGCVRGNTPHKFVWHNLPAADYEAAAVGRQIGPVTARAKWLFMPLGSDLLQVFGEFGGRLLLHRPGEARPARHHLLFELDDGSAISVMTQMWGMFALLTPPEIAAHKYAGNQAVAPLDEAFTMRYFEGLVQAQAAGPRRSAKGLLTQEGIIPGIGNAYCQDILFRAGLHPRRALDSLTTGEVAALHGAITRVLGEAIAAGGREDEYDLYGNRGGYARLMCQSAAGNPCPVCGTTVEKMQYLGGACYVCPACQR